ncbi:hypothetical protein CHARACLAT_014349 [Characodon lateralis]|uniref:Uncharacterized protein n=1 Tax=Characodon lateralis TaxID=208331 RepID=A0ABU7DUP2_9TELE|nr:hypothetical protein [Characodon lateralis]
MDTAPSGAPESSNMEEPQQPEEPTSTLPDREASLPAATPQPSSEEHQTAMSTTDALEIRQIEKETSVDHLTVISESAETSWVLDCSLTWISFLHATPPAGGWSLCPLVYLWFSVSAAGCFGVGWLTPGGCLPGPGPLGSVRPLLGGWCVPGSWAFGSMAGSARAWTAAGGARGLVAAAPWGFCTVAAGWFPWDSPLLFSGGVAVVPAVVLLGFLCF